MTTFMQLCAQSEAAEMDWGIVGSTVITGIAVVFLILAILVAFLWLMGKILGSPVKKKEKPAPSPAPSPTPAPVNEAAADDYDYDEDDSEIIAVIAAAIAAYGEAEGRQYRITRVKKSDKAARSGWSAAGIADNTRPF